MKLTIHRFFILLLSLAGILSPPSTARAQSCTTDYELIFELNTSHSGAFNFWDSLYGKMESEENLVSGTTLKNGHIVAVGLKEYTKVKGMGPVLTGRQLAITEIDLRGRMVWERVTPITDLIQVHKILPHKNGYIILVTTKAKKKKSVSQFIFIKPDGQIINQKTLRQKNKNLIAQDIELGWDGKTYLLVASVSKDEKSPQHTVFYRLNSKGKILNERSYRPGLHNIMLNISRSDQKFYIATGHMQDAAGKQNGWILKLNDKGEILWQRQYPRGGGARLIGASDFLDTDMIVTGQALPRTNGKSAGWVMRINRFNGETVWQRYYTSDHNNVAIDVITEKDGMISVMMNSKTSTHNLEGNFARILTINPRGTLFLSENYYNGEGAEASEFLLGYKRSRIIIGKTNLLYQIEAEGKKEPLTDRSMEGWLVAVPAPETYNDPCQKKKSKQNQNSRPDVETIFP